MWFEERSWGSTANMNMKISSSLLLVEEWRDIWSFKAEFIFVALAYLTATTNLLNFPYLMLANGGLAFVAAYGVAIVAVILPIIVLELAVGQLTGRGPIQGFYNICPFFKGIGVSQVVFSLFVMAYMTRYLAWLLIYLYHLVWTVVDNRPGLPWLQCTNFPELRLLDGECREPSLVFPANNASSDAGEVVPSVQQGLATLQSDSALNHFMQSLEQPSSSIDEIGNFQLYFVASQCAVWVLVFLGVFMGVRWLGKVVAFTFLLPLSLLLTLCGRSLFLAGAIELFVNIYDTTDWEKLLDYMVWKAAVEQAILASGIGFGAYITIGSYNRRANNLVKDSFLLLIGHLAITTLQVATVISLVGYVGSKTGLSPMELVHKGEDQMWQLLVYLSFIPHTKIFTALLLVMSIIVLLNVFYLLSLSILATLEDGLGERASRWLPRLFLALLVCLLGAACTTYFATQAGKHAYELASGYLKYVTLYSILALELFAVSWFYCGHTLAKDVRHMLANAACCSWCMGFPLLYLTYLLPAVPIAIVVINVMTYSFGVYSEAIHKWEWSEYLGIALALLPLLPIPLFAVAAICRSCHFDYEEDTTKCQRFKHAFRSPMQYEGMKSPRAEQPPSPRYSAAAPGYVLLPQAPLAEPEFIDASGNVAARNMAATMSTTTGGTGSANENRRL